MFVALAKLWKCSGAANVHHCRIDFAATLMTASRARTGRQAAECDTTVLSLQKEHCWVHSFETVKPSRCQDRRICTFTFMVCSLLRGDQVEFTLSALLRYLLSFDSNIISKELREQFILFSLFSAYS
jgi:hypothetical protein